MKKNKFAFSTIVLILISIFFIMDTKKELNEVILPYDDILNEKTKTINPDKPMIALTFDDGPHKKYTPMILDTLKEYHASATFFILGSNIEKAPDMLKRMQLEGHEIGNHTYSHKLMPSLSETRIVEEIDKTNTAIYDVIQEYPALLRTPYGSVNETIKNHLGKMQLVKWSVDTLDWKSKNTKQIVTKVLKEVKDKDILLFHDAYLSTAQAIHILVPRLIEEGYQLVTVSELYQFE